MRNDVTIYVGIDFSKEKFNVCLLMEQGIIGESEFPNTKTGYLKLTRWVKSTSEQGRLFDSSLVLFCGEHTGTCSIGLCEYLYSKGMKIWLESALKIKYGSGLKRVKDDKADAEMIAYYAKRFYESGSCALFEADSTALKTLRSLYQFRNRVVCDRVAMGNRISSGAFDCSTLVKTRMIKHHKEAQKDEKDIEKEMRKLMETSKELASNYQILVSFKGIGPITAAALIIYTSNFKKFDNPRKFACYCGIAPFGKQSGTSINTKPHVSRFAHIGIKAAIVQACKSAMQHNAVIKAYAQRLYAKGKHEGIVMNNVKNKVIHIIFKMIQTQTLWEQEYQQRHMEDGKTTPEEDGIGATEAAPMINEIFKTSSSVFIECTFLEEKHSFEEKQQKTASFSCVET